jgi:HSP20 family molecular chaperone IbpA
MTALMPRLLGDLTGWFDTDFPVRAGHLIRVEDNLSDTEYVLRAELPGLEPGKDIEVTVDDGILNVFAERREEEHTKGRSEFRYGTLQRSVRLPAGADADHINARYDYGILTVTVPLAGPERTGRQIPVTS